MEIEQWVESNVTEMPILMIEMLSLMRSLAVNHKTLDDLPESEYMLGIARKYQRMITPLLTVNITRGMTFGQMIRVSYKAVKVYSRRRWRSKREDPKEMFREGLAVWRNSLGERDGEV